MITANTPSGELRTPSLASSVPLPPQGLARAGQLASGAAQGAVVDVGSLLELLRAGAGAGASGLAGADASGGASEAEDGPLRASEAALASEAAPVGVSSARTERGGAPTALSELISVELRSLVARSGGDPILLMGLLQSAQSQSQVERGAESARTAGERSEAAALERERAIDRALDKAARKNRIPRWVRRLIKAVATIAATAVAVVSGGAGAVVLAGVLLLLLAPHIGKLAEKLGMSPDAAKWLTRGIQLAAAAMSLGAGLVQTSAAAVELVTAEVVSKVASIVQASIEASHQTSNAVFEFQAATALTQADAAANRVEGASLNAEQAMAVLRDGLASLTRELAIEEDMLRLRAEARQAVLANAV